MHNFKHKTAFVCLLLSFSVSSIVEAQSNTSCRKSLRTGECIEKKDKTDNKAPSAAVKYPNATRQEPEVAKSKIGSEWNALVKASSDGTNPEKIEIAAATVLSNEKASAYERSVAARMAAYAAIDQQEYSKAIELLQKAIQMNGLNNNDYYDSLLAIGQLQLTEDKYQDALKTFNTLIAETKTTDAKIYASRGDAYYRLEQYPAAIVDLKKATELDGGADLPTQQMLMASYIESGNSVEAVAIAQALVTKNPTDKKANLNLASIYLQADQPEKAAAVFDAMKAKGILTETSDYETGYKLLASIDGRQKDAAILINEGLASGKLQPSAQLYNHLGQAYYFSDQVPQAIEAWKKAIPLAKDGETALNLAKVYYQEGNEAESKKYAQLALSKGVKKPGEAYLALAGAENALGNKAAGTAALKEAEKYPESKAQATKLLKQAGAK